MRNLMRNLTLSAAALAALVSFAPKAVADAGGRGQGNGHNSQNHGGQSNGHNGQSYGGQSNGRNEGHGAYDRHDSRGQGYREPGRYAYAPPVRSFYGSRYAAPYRVYAGSRFYATRPGPGYFFVNALGWVFPPFPGAVWVPAHYDIGGFYVEGCWR